MYAFVGCYTTADRDGRGAGISAYRVDPASGVWEQVSVLDGIVNPSFLALDPQQRWLYCVHGGSGEGVSAFALDRGRGELRLLNTQPSGGINPVHLSIHPSASCLVVANYTGASVATLPIGPDGSLAPPSQVLELKGEPGPDPVEQSGPHPHDIPLDPTGTFAVVPDKGLDRVFVFRLDIKRRALMPTAQGSVQARAGAGPRHAAFHPRRPYVYVINELDSTVTTYRFDADSGALETLQIVRSLPPGFLGHSTGAEISVAQSGAHVYASNRGHDSIAIFGVDPVSGELTTLGWQPTQGRQPRHFAIDPSGEFLYAANQASDSITTFRADPLAGGLQFTGHVVHTGSPVSIVFANARSRVRG
ncbi:MAG: lactonase family protein [Chloroflexota bacterium]